MDLKELLQHHILDHIYDWINVYGFKLPISKHLFMILIASFILVFIFPLIVKSKSRFLSPLRTFIEMILLFVRDDIVIPNLGKEGKSYVHYFATLFFFILIMNLIGFVPYGATATGNISVTLGLALTSFILINFAGFRHQGFFKYLVHLAPEGLPKWLYPMIYPIEILGLITKTFALAIRLFANMIGGHIVILAFIGLIFIFGAMNIYLGLFVTAPVSIVLILFISLLELFVAFLQAYVFTVLTAIFTGAAIHSH